MKAKGAGFVVIGGEKYPVLMDMKAVAKVETDCGFASIIQIGQGLAYKSTTLIMFMLKHGLASAGHDIKTVDSLIDKVELDEFGAMFDVFTAIMEPIFPKKKDEIEQNQQA